MSTGFDILFSPPLAFTNQPIETYKKLLEVLLKSPNIIIDECQVTIYRRERPIHYDSKSVDPNTEFDEYLKGVTAQKLFEVIDSVQRDDIYVRVSCAYKSREWNNEICDSQPSLGSLTVEYEASTFGSRFRSKRLGPYRLLFGDPRHFSLDVIDQSRCPATSPEALLKLMRYGQNFAVLKQLFKQIAAVIEPQHEVLIMEGERVNPLNFHMVYHPEPAGLLFDAQKILQLHSSGGGYFYESREGASDAAYDSLGPGGSPYGNLLRYREKAEKMHQQLDFFTTVLGVAGLRETRLEDAEILEIITTTDEVEAETIDGGIFVASTHFLYGYLDAVYIKLLDAAASKRIGKN
jgi:hypothetical protein